MLLKSGYIGLWNPYSWVFEIWIKLGRKENLYVALPSAWSYYLVLLMQSTRQLLQIVILTLMNGCLVLKISNLEVQLDLLQLLITKQIKKKNL